jgi:hypothetical protein
MGGTVSEGIARKGTVPDGTRIVFAGAEGDIVAGIIILDKVSSVLSPENMATPFSSAP